MLQKILLLVFAVLTSLLHAQGLFVPPGVLDTVSTPKEGPCSQVNLSREQREKIKVFYFKTKEINLENEAKLNKISLDSEKVFNDRKSTLAGAQAVAQALVAVHSKLLETFLDYENQLYYSILKPEQRGPARLCEKMATLNEMFEGHPHGMFQNQPDMLPQKLTPEMSDKAKKD